MGDIVQDFTNFQYKQVSAPTKEQMKNLRGGMLDHKAEQAIYFQ